MKVRNGYKKSKSLISFSLFLHNFFLQASDKAILSIYLQFCIFANDLLVAG